MIFSQSAFFLQSAPTSSIGFALPLILMFGIMYFLLFLPMQRQKKKQQQMLSELKSGDRVITSGGMVGTITTLDKDTVVLRIRPDNVKIEVTRSSVSGLVPAQTDVATAK